MRKKWTAAILSLVLCLCLVPGFALQRAQAAEQPLEITGADLLRGSRSNVNRDLIAFNAQEDGLAFRGVYETNRPVAKIALKKGVTLTESFDMAYEILDADAGCSMDLGIICGDVDEVWMDPWDFLGIDWNDPGSVAKFSNIGGLTVRLNMSAAAGATVMFKGMGSDRIDAAFAVAGSTNTIPFAKEGTISYRLEGEDWSIYANGTKLVLEPTATLLNPAGGEGSQVLLNKVLNLMKGKEVFVFSDMSGQDGETSAVKLKSVCGRALRSPVEEDGLIGDSSYDKAPADKIEFSIAENYYLEMDGYRDAAFTYMSQPYQNPAFEMTEQGLKISGKDRLYGVNADLTYLTALRKLDGFSAVLVLGDMPATTSTLNSSVAMTLNGQKFASYYAWNSIYVKITFPYADMTKGAYATVWLWDKPVGAANVLKAEMPAQFIPLNADREIVVKVRNLNGNHYVYVNGVKFGQGYESAMTATVQAIQNEFYFSTMNVTSNLADGLAPVESVWNGVGSHYVKQIDGAAVVNELPTMIVAEAPYAPCEKDVTASSVKLSFSREQPGRGDSDFTVDGYLVERYADGNLEKTIVLKGADNRTFTDTGLKAATRYTYRVYSVQGVESDSPVRLVAYKPIAVTTLKASAAAAAAGVLWLPTVGGALLGAALIAVLAFLTVKVLRRPRIRTAATVSVRPVKAVKGRSVALRGVTLALSLCLTLGMFTACGGCDNTPGPGPEPDPTVEEKYLDTFENITTPSWRSGVMYNETVLPLKRGSAPASGKLAFAPKKILSVRDYCLEITYEQGRDYTVDENGVITLTEDSRCPSLKDTDLIYATRPQGVEGLFEFPSSSSKTPNLMYTETPFLVRHQLCVTYEYDNSAFRADAVSVANPEKLPGLRRKLDSDEPLRLAVLGDSISEGANSSGKFGISPYQPTYASLFRQYLEKTFDRDVDFKNFSMGGMTSAWGASRAFAVGQYNPDVVILSFGANDGGTGTDNSVTPVSVNAFMQNIRDAIYNVRKYNPNCEFILVSSMMMNPAGGAFGIQDKYADAMTEFAANDNSVVAVDMYHLYEYLVNDCGKQYIDLNSNNVNHPNDFYIRMYAMNIIAALWS